MACNRNAGKPGVRIDDCRQHDSGDYQVDYISAQSGWLSLDPGAIAPIDSEHFKQCPDRHTAKQYQRAAVAIEQQVGYAPEAHASQLRVPQQAVDP